MGLIISPAFERERDLLADGETMLGSGIGKLRSRDCKCDLPRSRKNVSRDQVLTEEERPMIMRSRAVKREFCRDR